MARRDTRELILQTSLRLFNHLGEPNVTTNLIADEAEISPGNLYYHFGQKQDIVENLFSRFAESLLPLIDISPDAPFDAESLWFRMHMVYEVKGQYRFIYRNLSDLENRMPKVDKALRAVLLREKTAITALFLALSSREVMRARDMELSLLTDQLMITLTYWIPFADLFDPQGFEDGTAQVKAIARIFLLTLPYLNEPWRGEAEGLAQAYLGNLD